MLVSVDVLGSADAQRCDPAKQICYLQLQDVRLTAMLPLLLIRGCLRLLDSVCSNPACLWLHFTGLIAISQPANRALPHVQL